MKGSVILLIKGRVQGVGCRYYVKYKAEMLGIFGFVKNMPQGNVYIEAEGEAENLKVFIDYCRIGPANAIVEDLQIQYCPLQDFQHFEIK
jgi:acylphosphatase